MTYRLENGKGHGDGNRSKNKTTVIKNVFKKVSAKRFGFLKHSKHSEQLLFLFKSILTDALNKQNAKPQEVLQSKIRRLRKTFLIAIPFKIEEKRRMGITKSAGFVSISNIT